MGERMKAEGCVLENVTLMPELWRKGDPVRPELNVKFKSAPGRTVYGLKVGSGEYVAFCCVARTIRVPKDIMELSEMTSGIGTILVPYTVWSLRRGAGKMIIKKLLSSVREHSLATRVVTLSPLTDMARRFHLKNGADEISTNAATANFEYPVCEMPANDDWYQSVIENDWECTPQGEAT